PMKAVPALQPGVTGLLFPCPSNRGAGRGGAMQPASRSSSTPPAAASPRPPVGEIDLTGQVIGDFHILRHLGQGGMGQVYMARQLSLKRKVAFKILRTELASNPISLKRFNIEAESAARATHANIVQVHAIGECNGLHYMALEYVEGYNLR